MLSAPVPDAIATELTVRLSDRDYHGQYDGDTDGSDEEACHIGTKVVLSGKRKREAGPRQDTTTITPRGGPSISVVATADLHRHHDMKYIHTAGGAAYTLAEWFESSDAPEHIDLALFAGDLGLDINEQLPGGLGNDKPARGVLIQPRQNDNRSLDSWRVLLRRMLTAKPAMHVCVVGGNHDGLLCSDDQCLSCHHTLIGRCRDGHPSWGNRSPSESAALARERLKDGLESWQRDRVHFLTDEAADIQLTNGVLCRVVGSPWTTYEVHGKEHLSISHHWRPQSGHIHGHRAATFGPLYNDQFDAQRHWEEHWRAIGALLEAEDLPEGSVSMLVTHSPPKGILDLVGGPADRHRKGPPARVGDEEMRSMLSTLRRPPLFACFGHVHARQSRDEPADGGPSRLAVCSRIRGTLFANVAAERQMPPLTGIRLENQALDQRRRQIQVEGRRLHGGSGPLPPLAYAPKPSPKPPPASAPGEGAIVPYNDGLPPDTALMPALEEPSDRPDLLMRPPTVVVLPASGFECERW